MTNTGKLETALGASRTGNSTWGYTYTDLTTRTQRNEQAIRQGREDRAPNVSPSRMELLLDNGDGVLTPNNPASTYYPNWDQGTVVRYSIDGQTPYLRLDGATGNASTPDAASLDIVGDMFGAIQFRGPCPSTRGLLGFGLASETFRRDSSLFSKVSNATTGISYLLRLLDGYVRFEWTTDGTTGTFNSIESLARVPQPAAGTNTLAYHIDVSDAGNHVVTFYWMRDTIAALRAAITAGDNSVLLGEAITTAGTTSIFSGTGDLLIGSSSLLGGKVWGQVEAFELRSGDHTGTIVANPDFTIQTPGAGSFADTAAVPKTWTINSPAAIDDLEPRGVAEIGAINPRWPGLGVDETATVVVNAQGVTRRLRQGEQPLRSSLFRWITGGAYASGAVLGYWSFEDGADATQSAAAIPGTAPMSLRGDYSLGQSPGDLKSASSVMTVAAGETVFRSSTLTPIPQVTGVNYQIRQLLRGDSLTGTTQIFALDIFNGAVATWRVTVSNTTITATGVDADGATVDSNTVAWAPAGEWAWVVLKITDDGANVDWEISYEFVTGDLPGSGGSTSDTFVGNTGVPRGVRNNLTGPTGGIQISHLLVTTDDPAILGQTAHAGEEAAYRMRRLCNEEQIYLSVHNDNRDGYSPFGATPSKTRSGTPMGPQLPNKTLSELIEECAFADGGLLTEHRTELGYHYRTRGALLNQTTRLDVDQGLVEPFEPAADDAGLVNREILQRTNGSNYTVQNDESIERRGAYIDSPTVSLESDDQLPDQANWRLFHGTIDKMRVPSLTIELAKDDANLRPDWVNFAPGDQIRCQNPPPWWPEDEVRQLGIGYKEIISPFLWTVEAVTIDADKWQVGGVDADTPDTDSFRLDTLGSELHTAVDDNDTTLLVATTSMPKWVTDNAHDPFDIFIGGERMTVTNVEDILTTFGAAGAVDHDSNASLTPGLPAGLAAGNLMLLFAAIRNFGTGSVDDISGWTRLPVFIHDEDDDTSVPFNLAIFARIAGASEVGPTVTFSNGVANATTSAQIASFTGTWYDVDNISVAWGRRGDLASQDIPYPLTTVPYDNSLVLYLGWKADDWTSVATISGATEIGEPDSTLGDDQGIVWDFVIQTSRAEIPTGSFVVTGGAAAVALGSVIVLTPDVQTFTVTRSVNGIVKSHAVGAEVTLAKPLRLVP